MRPTSDMTTRRNRETGARIRDERERAGLSQREVAERVGVQRRSVHDWEKGSFTITPEHLARVAEVLGVEERVLRSPEPMPTSAIGQLDRIETKLDAVLAHVRDGAQERQALEESIQLLRAELLAAEAEALKQIAEARRATAPPRP